jgi:hypothetical protein
VKSREASRIPRLPPRGVPPEFFRRFGPLDPETCKSVAEFCDELRRGFTVNASLSDIGARPGYGFSRSKGYELLRAGRYLLLKERGLWPTRRP